MEQHLAKFPKKRKTSRGILKFSEISQKFSFHSTLFPKFLEYLIDGSHFGNSTVSRTSGNFSGKCLYHLPLFPTFRKFWLNRSESVHCLLHRLSLPPGIPSIPRAFIFPSPQPPFDTKRPLQRREAKP